MEVRLYLDIKKEAAVTIEQWNNETKEQSNINNNKQSSINYKLMNRFHNEKGRYAGIVIKEDKVLLMYREKKGHKFYNFPGGHREAGEAPKDVVVREIKEEANIKVKNPRLVLEFFCDAYKEDNYYFLCEWESGELPELIGEERNFSNQKNYYEPRWVALSEIPQIELLPIQARDYLVRYLQNNKRI